MKEKKKTGILLALTLLLLFLTSKIWVEIPKDHISEENTTGTEIPNIARVLLPKKTIIHFGREEHTVFYEESPSWINGEERLKAFFREDDLTGEWVDPKALEATQNKPGITFVFDTPFPAPVFLRLLGEEGRSLPGDLHISSVTLCPEEKGGIIVTREGKNYRLTGKNVNFPGWKEGMEDLYDSKRYRNYERFSQRYGVNVPVFVPRTAFAPTKNLYFDGQTPFDDREGTGALAQRFFGKNIDVIREITEDNGVTYVDETKTLQFTNDGFIIFYDKEDPQSKEVDLTEGISTALAFLQDKMNLSADLHLTSIKEVEENHRKGIQLAFNDRENDRPVAVNPPASDFAVLEIFGNRVRKCVILNRKVLDLANGENPDNSVIHPDMIFTQNKDLLSPEGGDPQLPMKDVVDLDSVYVDPVGDGGFRQGLPAWEITMKDKKYYFNMETGEKIMEKAYGLV